MPSGPAAGGPDATDEDRALRADARRNRERLAVSARAAFAAATDGRVSLAGIARDAGVGIGTLYRHFPTRQSLVEVVYAAELDELADSATTVLASLPPETALRTWLDRYAQFLLTKRGMVDVLQAGGRSGTQVTRERITAALGPILAAGAQAGTLRGDVDPADVTAMLLGVSLATATGSTPAQTARLLALLVDALRPRPADRLRGTR